MLLASWNVNSLKVRLPHLLEWLAATGPDVVGLQETKLVDDAFPVDEVQAAGYHAVFSGQKTYNGVAILSREPASDVVRGIPGFPDEQKRVLAATIGNLRFVDLYVPNGKAVGDEKYLYKLDWLHALHGWLKEELAAHPELAVVGDFNVAPDDRDVHDPDEWRDGILCSKPEREALEALQSLGLADTFRLFNTGDGSYSWWDYRQGGFRRNRGLRIDQVLASAALVERCMGATIDVEPRTWERPSDHAPVFAQFSGGPGG
jgi:exodeoxyribonuclease-3